MVTGIGYIGLRQDDKGPLLFTTNCKEAEQIKLLGEV